VECGFLTNPSEAAYISNSSYRQKLAEEIAAGIRERSNVRSSTSSTAVATIPLQPYIDQTKVSSSKRSRKKSSKSSKRKKSRKSTGSKANVTSEKREA
jgi:N-acetylmuramoyl-L-alanine amidase